LPAETGTMPDVRGMGLKDALFVLESRGLKVRFSGRGAVVRQSVAPGARITPGATVAITLN
ncbi:MAG: PASTA domain-containing protein, partial [Alistipes sp.]|nr:PASTA domain-containing protein [Alistipes sp.]